MQPRSQHEASGNALALAILVIVAIGLGAGWAFGAPHGHEDPGSAVTVGSWRPHQGQKLIRVPYVGMGPVCRCHTPLMTTIMVPSSSSSSSGRSGHSCSRIAVGYPTSARNV